jgi:type IX secretion system PorP/SprF family membrane protein
MLKRGILLLGIMGLAMLSQSISAQQLPDYSQYNFNKFLLNPAAAGSDGYTTVSVVAREQWVGFKGTPKTHAATIDSRLLRNSYISKDASVRKKKRLSTRSGRVGWAGHLYNDHFGELDRFGIEGTYAYHIPISKGQLSFGVSGVFYQFKIDKSDIDLGDNEADPLLDGMKGTIYIPDANFGIMYNSSKIYGGFSMMQLLQSSVHFGDDNGSSYRLKRSYNLMAGYFQKISNDFVLEPSMLLKVPTSARPQFDFNTKLYYKGDYWAGMSYRTRDAFIMYFGARIDRYFVGYAFAYNFSPLGHQTYGTHEFMAAIKLGDNARRYRWLNAY